MTPEQILKHSAEFPYDWDDECNFDPAPDWAHAAARGVLADLTDRRGIKHELDACDEEIRKEITLTLAAIIRAAPDWFERQGV